MSWFLVLLFWNPMAQGYDLAPGFPLPTESFEICDRRLQYAENYLPQSSPDDEYWIECISAPSPSEAIDIMIGAESA